MHINLLIKAKQQSFQKFSYTMREWRGIRLENTPLLLPLIKISNNNAFIKGNSYYKNKIC